ncbi:Subtilisin-like protease SBT2.6 [Zea mays]|nr:Subtilisin-like protease SBT2.6 [Zea mays]
MGGPWNA